MGSGSRGLRPLILTLALFLSACGKKGPDHVLLPGLDSEGQATLREVKVETLPNPRVVYGPAAVVYENPLLLSTGFDGKAVEPRLTQTDEAWIPMDVKSSSALAIYYGYELIKKFESRVIPDFSVSWPRKVAFDLQFTSGDFINNAFYMGDSDVTVILPYKSNGLPIAFNSGILAHEHFHAHFHQMIGKTMMAGMESYFATPQSHLHGERAQPNCDLQSFPEDKAKPDDPDFVRVVNFYIIRGWNEGLADLYATLVTGMTNFFDSSLDLDGLRKVDRHPGRFIARRTFEEALYRDLFPERESAQCESLDLAYAMGIEVARSIYENIRIENKTLVGPLSPSAREEAVRAIFTKLSEIASSMSTRVNNEKVSTTWILDQLLPAVRSSTGPLEILPPVEPSNPDIVWPTETITL